MMRRSIAVLAASATLALAAGPRADAATAPADPYQPQPYMKVQHPDWSRDATIYEINLRQFTPEGTLRAAESQLPRLKELGVGILWLMPIHPIGREHRKGTLGSPYSVRDYYQVNAHLGTLADLKHFVAAAHVLGMHVILDWVANHSAWDNVLVKQHPDWYSRDWKGDFHSTSWWDWSDIIEFDYSKPGLRRYMTEAMKYWVREADVDGFRCDMAHYVPLDFWNEVRRELDTIKPVFMLAESDFRDMHQRAFDATYAFGLYDALHQVTTQGAGVGALAGYYSENDNAFPRAAMRLTYVSNHDKNSWDGTAFEQFGGGLHAAMVLTFVGDGIPLIYNGQEAGNTKRLAFFQRDPIAWHKHPNGALYHRLIELKKAHRALWNAPWGARMIPVANDSPEHVLSFVRQEGADKVFAVFNFSARTRRVKFLDRLAYGQFRDYFTSQKASIDSASTMTLPPWTYSVLLP